MSKSKMHEEKINHDYNERISVILYQYRDSLDISRKDLALMISTTDGIIRQTENRTRKLKITEVLIICADLGIDPNELLKVILSDLEVSLVQLSIPKSAHFIGLRQDLLTNCSFCEATHWLKMPLASLLEQKRKLSGHTMRSAAESIGVVHSFIAKIKNGRHVCFAELLLPCQIYQINILVLINDFISQVNAGDKPTILKVVK